MSLWKTGKALTEPISGPHGFVFIQLLHRGSKNLVYRAQKDNQNFIAKISLDSSTLKHEYAILQQLKQVEGVVKAQQLLEFESHELLIMPDSHSISLDRWLDQTYSESHSQQSSSLVKYVNPSPEGLRRKRRQMELVEFFSIANQLCRTLFELQKRQIFHCDINPSNILIELKTGKVQLIDFGLALNGSDLREGGTFDYLAPEQAGRTGKRVDHRSDLYALGASFFDLLCGVPVFECSERMELVHSHLAKKPRRVDQLRTDIPVDLANLIDKLLCKQKQDRYQSAFGVLCDLEIIQQRLNSASAIDVGTSDITHPGELKLAERDFSDEFIVSNKLYGCQSELELLDRALNQVEKASNTNQPQSHVVIINGPSGSGKSFIVDHFRKQVGDRCKFVSGKFDQFDQQPISALIGAFEQLVNQLASSGDSERELITQAIKSELGDLAQLIVLLVPFLETIIGKQTDIEDLPPDQSKNRLNSAIVKFIRSFSNTKPGQPLVIFIDDIQWADMLSVGLICELLTATPTLSLLLVCTRRDTEAGQKICDKIIEQIASTVQHNLIDHEMMNATHMSELIQDSTRQKKEDCQQLAQSMWRTTRGNSFFACQILRDLHHHNVIKMDYELKHWVWNQKQAEKHIMSAGDLLQLVRNQFGLLGWSFSGDVLLVASCIGLQFNARLVAKCSEFDLDQVNMVLDKCQQLGLIDSEENDLWHFVHDSTAQIAYEQKNEQDRKRAHWKVGMQLIEQLANLSVESNLIINTQSEADLCVVDKHTVTSDKSNTNQTSQPSIQTFQVEIVRHMNQGRELIDDSDYTLRMKLARMELQVASKLEFDTSYDTALQHYKSANQYTQEAHVDWDQEPELCRHIQLGIARTSFLIGDRENSTKIFDEIVNRVSDDLLIVTEVQSQLLTLMTVALDFGNILKLGVDIASRGLCKQIPLQPTQEQIGELIDRVLSKISHMSVDQLASIDICQSPVLNSMSVVISKCIIATFFINQALYGYLCAFIVDMCLDHGYTSNAGICWAGLSWIFGSQLSKFEESNKLSQSYEKILDRFPKSQLPREANGLAIIHGVNLWWNIPFLDTSPVVERNYELNISAGDLNLAGYTRYQQTSALVHGGMQIDKIIEILESYMPITLKVNMKDAQYYMQSHLSMLCALSNSNIEEAIEKLTEKQLKTTIETLNLPLVTYVYWLTREMGVYLLSDYDLAFEMSNKADEAIKLCNSGMKDHVIHSFYRPMILLEMMHKFDDQQQIDAKCEINKHLAELKRYSFCQTASLYHYYLIALAYSKHILFGESIEALQILQDACQRAQQLNSLHTIGICNSLIGKIHQKLSQDHFIIARNSMRNFGSRSAASTITRRMTGRISELSPTVLTTTTTDLSSFEVEAILKASQELSCEINLEILLQKLMKIVLEFSGAQKGVLVTLNNLQQLSIEASCSFTPSFTISYPKDCAIEYEVPISMINNTLSKREPLLIEDATNIDQDSKYGLDRYFTKTKPKSILCIPIQQHSKATGVLYLENSLSTSVFDAKHVATINMLSSQIAISLSNAQLVDSLKKSTAELQNKNTELAEMDRLKDALLANTSHELRTPLNAVIGGTTILAETNLDSDQQDLVSTIKHSGETLLRIVNDILDLSKLQAGKLTLDIQPFELRPVIELVLDQASVNINPESDLFIAYQISPACSQIINQRNLLGDPNRLQQILANLVDNAIKFTKHGHVLIEVDLLEHEQRSTGLGLPTSSCRIQFSIKDTGLGIAQDKLLGLFKMFSQIEQTNSRRFGGTGLGLSICKRLSNLMGGDAWAESQEGTGSCFAFTAVFTIGETLEPKLADPNENDKLLRGKRAALAIDNPLQRRLVMQCLQSAEVNCQLIENESKVELSQNCFDFMLVDCVNCDRLLPKVIDDKLPILQLAHRRDKQTNSRVRIINKQTRLSMFANAIASALTLSPTLTPASQNHQASLPLPPPVVAVNNIDQTNQQKVEVEQKVQRASSAPVIDKFSTTKKVLVVEDNSTNAKLVIRMLQSANYSTVWAENGLKAIEEIEKNRFDAVLMDIQMPVMDGLEATKEIRRRKLADDTPIIALTASADNAQQKLCADCGFDEFLRFD